MLAELTTINITDIESKPNLDVSSEASAKKRPFSSEDSMSELLYIPNAKEPWVEEKTKRSKRFRAEWLNEAHFKDWLQPHPTDETYCICVACDIRLRCGKSELEKHASGLKHTKRYEAMKDDPNYKSRLSTALAERAQSLLKGGILCEESGTFYTSSSRDQHHDDDSEAPNGSSQELSSSTTDNILSQILVKLSEFLENNSEVSNRKLEMAETEHQSRMQILNKELQLKNIELQIKQAELQKLTLGQGKVLGIKKILVNHSTDKA